MLAYQKSSLRLASKEAMQWTMRRVINRRRGRVLLWSLVFGFAATATQAQNRQIIDARDSIINSAGTGGRASMNISSTCGITAIHGNNQVTHINGIVLNSAAAGARAELNIASKTASGSSGNQTVSIAGAVVNQAGAGKTSVINIGGIR